MSPIRVALIDDHKMLREGLAMLIKAIGYEVLFQGSNGREMIEFFSKGLIPDLVLMDLNMPEVDGFEATSWITKNYPLIPVLALSMYEDELAIIRMLKAGAKGYVMKESEPGDLRIAINDVLTQGIHLNRHVTGKLLHSIARETFSSSLENHCDQLTDKEKEFLKLACSEYTYKEIADKMNLSPRTIDGYRDALFEKLGTKSRVGLVLFAIKHKLFIPG